MYFHLVCSPEFFAAASERKSTRKHFCQATQLMDLIDHEFVENSTSPPFAVLSCPFHMDISLLLGKRLTGVFFGTHMGAENPSQNRALTLTLCTCEHERKQLNIMLTRPIALGYFQFEGQLHDGSTRFNAYQNMVA